MKSDIQMHVNKFFVVTLIKILEITMQIKVIGYKMIFVQYFQLFIEAKLNDTQIGYQFLKYCYSISTMLMIQNLNNL